MPTLAWRFFSIKKYHASERGSGVCIERQFLLTKEHARLSGVLVGASRFDAIIFSLTVSLAGNWRIIRCTDRAFSKDAAHFLCDLAASLSESLGLYTL
jgi:hypothetical protein